MLSSGGEWKDCGGSRDLSLLLVMKLFIRKNQKVIPSGAARASYKTYERRRKKVPFTKPMTSHQLPSSEDPGIPLSLPIESSSLLPVTPAPSDSNIDLPIALRKGKGSCTIHPITQFLSFQRLLLETKSDSSGYATPPSGGLTTATFIEEFGVTTAFDGNP